MHALAPAGRDRVDSDSGSRDAGPSSSNPRRFSSGAGAGGVAPRRESHSLPRPSLRLSSYRDHRPPLHGSLHPHAVALYRELSPVPVSPPFILFHASPARALPDMPEGLTVSGNETGGKNFAISAGGDW